MTISWENYIESVTLVKLSYRVAFFQTFNLKDALTTLAFVRHLLNELNYLLEQQAIQIANINHRPTD